MLASRETRNDNHGVEPIDVLRTVRSAIVGEVIRRRLLLASNGFTVHRHFDDKRCRPFIGKLLPPDPPTAVEYLKRLVCPDDIIPSTGSAKE
jgi:hypothetical protein